MHVKTKAEDIIEYAKNAESIKTEKLKVHFIDSEPYVDEFYEIILSSNSKVTKYQTDDFEINSKLTSFEFTEYANLKSLELGNWLKWIGYKTTIYITSLDTNENLILTKIINLRIAFEPNFQNWKNPYSFQEYFDNFIKIRAEGDFLNKIVISFTKDIPAEIVTKFTLKSGTIGENLLEIENELSTIHKAILVTLEKNYEDSLLTSFNFPKEIKINCEQYLLYFAQFLQDLGINATSDLKEEAGKVLFSVTPTDDVEALDKIREALAVYLNLPASPIVYNDSFAAMRLQQQIENLQHSQRMAVRELQFNEKLLTAQSDTIREKNITISQQQSVIEQQDKIIEKISSKSIMMDSVENKEELEEICEGLKIGKSKFLMEQIGVHINPATFAKGIGKKILGKQETTSIIETNEENK